MKNVEKQLQIKTNKMKNKILSFVFIYISIIHVYH